MRTLGSRSARRKHRSGTGRVRDRRCAMCWRERHEHPIPGRSSGEGSQLHSEMQGIKILGTPLGHPDFVARHLEGVLEEQRVFLSRIPLVNGIRSALLLLLHCADARANYQISHARGSGGVRGICLWSWGDSVCGALLFCENLPTVPVGQIVW